VPTGVIITGIDIIGGMAVAGTVRAAEGRTAYHTDIVEREELRRGEQETGAAHENGKAADAAAS
jgi:hypothetical protein